MSQSEETKTEVVLSRGDWGRFLSSLERLITLHRKTIQRLKDLRIQNQALRSELRSALALPTLKPRPGKAGAPIERLVAVQRCLYCNREIELSANFCDQCGTATRGLLCECGRELGKFDKFCDRCGRPVTEG